MKPELEKLCQEYIANREEVGKAFRWDNSALHTVCANIFCACGKAADSERLKDCRRIIKENTRFLSKFRSKKVRAVLASMLSLEERPEDRMALANEYYHLLKKRFKGTEYLVLTAFLLADLAHQTLTEETISRGKEIYRRMKKKHPLLTSRRDSVFAMLMAFSEKAEDELTDETEACYQALKKKFSGSGAQTSAQVLAMADGAPEEKTQRVTDLHNALREAEIKYGHAGETAPLAALSLADTPLSALAEEIKEADDFLKTQKGFGGTKESEQAQRAMYAVMIVSDQYAGTNQVGITVMTNTIDMLIAKQKATRMTVLINLAQIAVELLSKSKEQTEAKTEQEQEQEKEQ
ncbi:MAG: DUF4003 family protein [Clostridia bacterium]|nr:DUF4003 family protein [Clostridia bacterium]